MNEELSIVLEAKIIHKKGSCMAVQLPFFMGFSPPPQETIGIKRLNSNLCSNKIIIEQLFSCQEGFFKKELEFQVNIIGN